jgi:uncharacterized membrane protein
MLQVKKIFPFRAGTRWRGLFLLVTATVLLGVFFRFAYPDSKIYWHDETFTSLRISGYTEAEVVRDLTDRGLTTVETLRQYQTLNPDRTLADSLRSLATEDPQHPPLYYASLRFWAQAFGSSIAAIRSYSALLSLLVLPCIYWLCWELFQPATLPGWIAVALTAVSPIHLVYAQEARQYSLVAVTVLASSAALLRSIRLNRPSMWSVYALTLAASFYTFLFSALIAIGHGIYVLITERFQLSKTVRAYLLASLLATLVFLPWMLVVVTNFSQAQRVTAWTGFDFPLPALVRGWVLMLSRISVDWNYQSEMPFVYKLSFYGVSLLLLLLIGYAFYYLWRTTDLRAWFFVFTLTWTTALVLAFPDVLLGGQRSITERFLIPCYLGIQLAVAYLLASKMSQINTSDWQRSGWQLLTVAVLGAGVLSCAVSAPAQVWWNQVYNRPNPEIAKILEQAQRPLIIADGRAGELLSLGHLLDPQIALIARPHCYTCKENLAFLDTPYLPAIPDGFDQVFFFSPRFADRSEQWRDRFKAQTQIKPLVADEKTGIWLWQLQR